MLRTIDWIADGVRESFRKEGKRGNQTEKVGAKEDIFAGVIKGKESMLDHKRLDLDRTSNLFAVEVPATGGSERNLSRNIELSGNTGFSDK